MNLAYLMLYFLNRINNLPMENVNLNLKPPAQTRFLFLSFFL
jgi:hypothetical protein